MFGQQAVGAEWLPFLSPFWSNQAHLLHKGEEIRPRDDLRQAYLPRAMLYWIFLRQACVPVEVASRC